MSNEQQTQATDDPSGPGWRDVEVGGVTQDGDMVRVDGHWGKARPGETVFDGDIVRRRSEQSQPSDSEQRSESTLWGKLHAAMKQDREFAWTVHCNYAMQVMDEDVAHGTANRAAARIMLYFHHIDITQNHHWARMFEGATPQQSSDSETETMEQLRTHLATSQHLLEMSRRQVQDEAGKVEQLKEQVQALTRERDRYRNQLSGAIEHSSAAAGRQQVLESLQAWLRPVLELVAEHPDDCGPLAVSVLGYLPGIASRLIEE